jgi:hypothetical protein
MFEKYEKWMSDKLKTMSVWDIKHAKLSAVAFTLMLAKFFPVLLGLEWYWYALAGVFFMWRPLRKVLAK